MDGEIFTPVQARELILTRLDNNNIACLFQYSDRNAPICQITKNTERSVRLAIGLG